MYLLYSIVTVLQIHGILYGYIITGVPSALAQTLGIIHKASILAVLSSLGRGLLTARTGEPPKRRVPVRVATYATAALMTILTIAAFGLWISYVVETYNDRRDPMIDTLLNINRLNSVAYIFVFIGSVISLVAAVVIFTKIKEQYPTLKTVSLPSHPHHPMPHL